MEERVFWHEMTPRRLHNLFDAYFGMSRREMREKPAQNAKNSLLSYIYGGE